jgi:hypothetical protein
MPRSPSFNHCTYLIVANDVVHNDMTGVNRVVLIRSVDLCHLNLLIDMTNRIGEFETR